VVGAAVVVGGTVVVIAVPDDVVAAEVALVDGASVEAATVLVEDGTAFDVVGAVEGSGAMDGREPLHADAARTRTAMPTIGLDRVMRGLYAERSTDRCTDP